MRSLNFTARFIELATEINGQMPEHVAGKIADLLNQDRLAVNGSRILVLGVAYKKNVSDMRESPALDIVRLLQAKGAEVVYHDPHVPELDLEEGQSLKSVELTDQELAAADLAVIVTDHSAVDYDRVVARAQRVYDTRNATKAVRRGREKVHTL
jgi:UDP-N-acetyl-D-glucosamine dehydrogenase